MIKVGQKVRFRKINVVHYGTVNFVHPTHRWFNVKHGDDEYEWLTGFKFDEIGKTVRIIKE